MTLTYTLTWDNSGYNIASENRTWKGNWGTPLLMPFGHLTLLPNNLTKNAASEKGFYFTVRPIGAAANNYANALTTEIPNKQTSIINLQLRTTLPRQGTDMLNALISAYQASTVDDNNQLNDSTLTFINERLSIVGKELDSIEIKIQGFKQQNRLTDLPMQSQALIDNMGKQDQELNAQSVQLSMVNSMMDYLVANRNNPRVIPASLVVNNPSISAAIDNYNRLLAQKRTVATQRY
jgi:tyrosine-protein kinase Etk/Wzc